MDTVLKAYADAYPDSNPLVLNFPDAPIKYFPSETYVQTMINKDFVDNKGNQDAISRILRADAKLQQKIPAFIPRDGKGSWGYFEATDVDDEYSRHLIKNFLLIFY